MPDLALNARPEYVIACDIGGTKMRTALLARSGSVSQRFECATRPERGIDRASEELLELIRKSMAAVPVDKIAGISISTAGPVDPVSGIYNHPPNLTGWHGHSMIPYLSRETGLPVTVIHDAHAAAFAEAQFGVARHAKDVIYVTVSTGIGGGMIADGKAINGEHGFAGEVGHMIIDPGGPSCNAGCWGCLEVLASGGGCAAEARRRIAAGSVTSILDFADGDAGAISGKNVYQAAHAGDPVALEIVDTAIDALSTGLANLLAAFDPGALVIGGSVISGDDTTGGLSTYWDELLDRVKQRALLRYRNQVPIVKSSLGDDVGLIGAAAYIFDQLKAGES